ncbi:MAG: leucyl aminopeptidase [Candidatus Burarchaeum sp.]|nr:leucyl aminopeptidase [Candidatus Burarchaeum sp.]MDO8339917.1 leucyl aminopeptidase [Candidatus Burarchaeum sp.]
MKLDVKVGEVRANASDALVVFSFEDLDLMQGIAKLAKEERFKGKKGEINIVRAPSGFKCKHILLAGLGKREKADSYTVYGTAGRAAQCARSEEMTSVAFMLPETAGTKIERPAKTVCEGALNALYKFDEFKSKSRGRAEDEDEEEKELARIEVLCPFADDAESMKKDADEARILSESLKFTRDLANYPSNLKRPPELAEKIRREASKAGLGVRIFDEKAMKHMEMNAMLAVGVGSTSPPRLVVLEYGRKAAGKPTLCLVGKGITFDSGGISLKPSKGMDEMKGDMAGAAAVAGAMIALARLKVPLHIVGVMPLCENMPSGSAQRPGDIVKAMNGKTIEVLNTDAEGRMVLADAVAYAEKNYKSDYLVDIATLTGAVSVCFGEHATGLLSNDDKLREAVITAGQAVHERCWALPFWDEYKDMVKSKVADVKNIGSEVGDAGTITAACFVWNFLNEKTKWAHLDIAGTSWMTRDKPFRQSGATGVGVRLLVELARNLTGEDV